ncbi:MAG TPA: nucleotidyltransferase family protein [Pyrinomonadaceae bacterium]|nr:nucleotidyltransferase family protein [Pyrinomonadaceae bacterium]
MRSIRSRPEHELLLLIARRELDAAEQSRLRDLLSEVRDWDYVFTLANNHGLVPLLHTHLHSIDAELVPTNVRSRLKRQSLSNTQNVLHLMAKQLKLYRQLRDHNIPVAIFKGSVLSQMAYGDISLRQAGDIDVLISRSDFTRARQVLESLGYQMMPSLTTAQLTSHLRSHCEIQFVRDDWFTVVDLHWALAPKTFVFKLETDEVMERLQCVEVAGTEIETLGTEDLILYLSMHGAKHLWRASEWVSSLGELIRAAESIAWDTVVERAAQAHATRMLGLALRLVERVAGGGIVAQVLETVDKEEQMKRMADQILSQIFAISGPADSTETNLYNLRIMDRKRDALASALRAIFVPTFTDWSSLYLPSSLFPLYYAYRPLRLSRIYSTLLLRKLTSKGAACL